MPSAPLPPTSLLEELKLKTDSNFVPAKDGVDAYGLYIELIRFSTKTGQWDFYLKAFLFENSVALYVRQHGKKSGRWETAYYEDHTEARAKLLQQITNLDKLPNRVLKLRGEPLLIQAQISDVVSVRNKEKRGPDCRWRGTSTLDARHGKVLDDVKLPADEITTEAF